MDEGRLLAKQLRLLDEKMQRLDENFVLVYEELLNKKN